MVGSMASLNTMVTNPFTGTPVVSFAGVTVLTVGGVTSMAAAANSVKWSTWPMTMSVERLGDDPPSTRVQVSPFA